MIFKSFFGLILLCYGVWAFPERALLGAKECTWGPSYWCKNLTAAKSCSAVNHCIQTVWVHQKLPEDNDDICTICKKMVQDARDQLESNETVDELKQVLEGSCKLMLFRPVVKICKKLADDAVPDLVDMISSQMDPQVVCSVAGLCNNAEIDKMIEDRNSKKTKEVERAKELQQNCSSCLDFGNVLKTKLDKSSEDDLKMYLLERCRGFGSFSDGCSSIILSNFNAIHDQLRNHFTSSSFCFLTGNCIGNASRQIQVKTESDIGVVHVNKDAVSVTVKHLSDDQTCDLCKQLVKHLKDIAVADTTKNEFRQVLQGICKQTGNFKDECLSLVGQYYGEIYDFIANDINGNEICSWAGICPGPQVFVNGPLWPLLPEQPVPIKEEIYGNDEHDYSRVALHKSEIRVHSVTPVPSKKIEISFGDSLEPSQAQLPLERFFIPQHRDLEVNDKEACIFCQYFLHYIQKIITQPYGENAIKKVVNKACEELPNSLNVQCKDFVEMYGDAFVAILAQEIDPSQVCPSLHVCPANKLADRYDPIPVKGRPGCPLCLLAVEELIEKLKDNKTEESVREALDNLCANLPKSLVDQCDELVKKYTDDIIDMIVADMTPQEVCEYLKICAKTLPVELIPTQKSRLPHYDILTNEILQEEPVKVSNKKLPGVCVLCEFVMDKLEGFLGNSTSEEDIERTLERICPVMPKTIRHDCQKFMEKYSSTVIKLLTQFLTPKSICTELSLCDEATKLINKGMLLDVYSAIDDCALCESLVGALEALLDDKTVDTKILDSLKTVCVKLELPSKCTDMVTSYGPSMLNLLSIVGRDSGRICAKMDLCDHSQIAKVHMIVTEEQNEPLVGGNRCTWGPSFWCQSEEHAAACGTLAHCREIVWKNDKPLP